MGLRKRLGLRRETQSDAMRSRSDEIAAIDKRPHTAGEPFMEHMHAVLLRAEDLASRGADLDTVLDALRSLCLDDFGLFVFCLPHPDYPSLSKLMPPMASPEAQQAWTGGKGMNLLARTVSFVHQLAGLSARFGDKALGDASILDFGCGYGRLTRMLYYFSSPSRIWGVDPMQSSIDTLKRCNIPSRYALSERLPEQLPVEGQKFDLAFAFSVFTHLSPKAASSCLTAIRKSMAEGGIFVPTIRPPEYWRHFDRVEKANVSDRLIATHKAEGFAHHPLDFAPEQNYGDSTIDPSFFDREGWRTLGYARSLNDPFQIAMVLKAV